MAFQKGIFRLAAFLFIIFRTCLISYAQPGSLNKNTGGNMLSFSELKYIDIGKDTKPGKATISNDELVIDAGGSDIWEKHDEFLFGYMKIKGDFDITVRILSLTAAHLYTKAGLMARTDLSDSSQHVYYQVFPDNSARNNNTGGCEFQYRSSKGESMKAIYPDKGSAGNKFDVSFPDTWIRLKRKGNSYISYFSRDNKNWNEYTTFTQIMPSELFIGIAVTAHNPTILTTARFSSPLMKVGK